MNEPASPQGDTEANVKPYTARISRRTVDKLGVKLYDRASAVVAELVANGYDADADVVWVRLPLATALATKKAGQLVQKGYVVEVEDDGHGMTPEEAQSYFLEIGRDRRKHQEQGGASRKKGRPVMGRKGIGKLAPFGICRRIEVISSGGEKQEEGYLTSHFFLDYDTLVDDTYAEAKLESGDLDRTYRSGTGTTIRLTNFLPKRVPDRDTFERQMAMRFAFASHPFELVVEDTRKQDPEEAFVVKHLSVPIMPETRVDLTNYPVAFTSEDETDDDDKPIERKLEVTGWLALAKDAYKNEEMSGVRIYARDKIVATTRDFEQPAGYTGEYTIRSYLVGEVYAEWLDLDDGEDLVRSDRQGIIWDSEYGRALRKWGAELIVKIGSTSRAPRRVRVGDLFLERSGFAERAKDRFADAEIRDVAVDLAKQIGRFAAEDELGSQEYLDSLSEIVLSVAPHKALISAFQRFAEETGSGGAPIEQMIDLFGKAKVAETASFGQIASQRVRVIHRLEEMLLSTDYTEDDLQKLIEQSRWLIEPAWTPITQNQSLSTFRKSFESYWRDKHPDDDEVILSDGLDAHSTKRPDFTLAHIGHALHIVEIKARRHVFTDADFSRLYNYVQAFRRYFKENERISLGFRDRWVIDLVTDEIRIRDPLKAEVFEKLIEQGEVKPITWDDFLDRAVTTHELFLEAARKHGQIVREMELRNSIANAPDNPDNGDS